MSTPPAWDATLAFVQTRAGRRHGEHLAMALGLDGVMRKPINGIGTATG